MINPMLLPIIGSMREGNACACQNQQAAQPPDWRLIFFRRLIEMLVVKDEFHELEEKQSQDKSENGRQEQSR
jgi:hypothetical protein